MEPGGYDRKTCLTIGGIAMAAPVQRHPLAAQAAELLLGRITAGEWPLGHRLPGETVLSAQLGIGRSTLREAIRELAGKGVLETRQGAGIFVTSLEASEDWSAVLRRASIASVIEARIAIETEAAALAADRRTAADVRAMRRALDARVQDGQTLEQHVDADMALHRAIVAGSHNDVLVELFDGFVPRIRHAMIDMLRLRPAAARHDGAPSASAAADRADHAAHADLVQAIADRDASAAAQLSRSHLVSLKAALA
jgi:DNA-binding FadR family transcriptional regulator